MTRYLLAVTHDAWPASHPAEYAFTDAESPEAAVLEARYKLFGESPLGPAVVVSAIPMPEHPVKLCRLRDRVVFDLELLVRLPTVGASVYDGQ